MKQYTSKEQSAKLIELGFPKPQSIESIDTEFDSAFDEHTIYNMRYSIGELIAFMEANADISIWYDGNYGYWSVDYDLRRVGLDEHLINALYFACKKLKEEGVI